MTTTRAQSPIPKIEYARAHAEAGHHIFPCHWTNEAGACSCGSAACKSPGKHPLTPNGHREATDDLFQVEVWWQEHPEANIALVPGRSGYLVLDADTKKGKVGLETLAELEREHPTLKAAPRVRTPSGGIHAYIRLPPNTPPIGNASPFKDVDLRAHRGYVMAIGSVIGGTPYEWVVS
jgi:hypothetical protein